MADIVLYGSPASTYVRSASAVLIEKGVAFTRGEVEMGSDGHRAVHPFERIPAIRHGDFALYETSAIMRYVDEAFPGPSLQPKDVRARARMEQWLSAINAYVYDAMVRGVVLERLVAPMRGRAADEAKIAAALPKVDHQLGVLEKALGEAPYLSGGALGLADFLLMPIFFYLGLTPEGEARFKKTPHINTWKGHWQGRKSFTETMPPRPAQAAE